MLSDREIGAAAEDFRKRHWPSGAIPVDIELIVERSGIEIIPAANLRRDVGVEACVSADLTAIHVDLGYCLDERMAFRVRFSVAHELGHCVLHRRLFEDFRKAAPTSILEWARHVRDRFEIGILEREANEFAGCLLVPQPELRAAYDHHYPIVCEAFRVRGMALESVPSETIRSYMAGPIQKTFEVSTAVIEIRLRKCGICSNG